jgi:tetratricopeptide (TPR) repeat protein
VSQAEFAHGFREAALLLEIEESRLRYWAQTGLVTPSGQRGPRRYYTFSDLVALRAVQTLTARGVDVPRIREALRDFAPSLPSAVSTLASLRIGWDGARLRATEQDESGEGDTLFLASEIRSRIEEAASAPDGAPSAYDHFVHGLRLDEQPGAERQAEAAYRRAVELDPMLGSAWTNLGNLLHRAGDAAGARRCYERSLEAEPEQPEARYNLANLLDESGEAEQALAEYERTLRQSPDFADAHHNLALLLERIGAIERAQLHMRRYQELCNQGP